MQPAQTFDEFLEKRYVPLELEFLEIVARDLNKNISSIRKFFLEELRRAMAQACEIQRNENKICAYMSISLLNTSLIDDKPLLQVDFYNEEWVYGESWARYRMSADFLFKHWKNFKIDALDENFFVRSKINRVEIKSLFWGTVDKIIFLFACYAKYLAPRLAYYNEFDELVKAEKFYVTCGTYLDWQNRVFGVLPETDFFNLDANEETTFRPLRKKILHNKNLNGLDLRHCIFEECTFRNFIFENLKLTDANFLNCRFINCTFDGVKIAGGDFFECYFKDSTFKNCTSDPVESSDNGNEYFAPLRMYHCYLLNVKFESCHFENLVKLDCFEKE